MNKILFSLAAMTVLSIGFASEAQAAPRGHASYASYNRSSGFQRSGYNGSNGYNRNFHVNNYQRNFYGNSYGHSNRFSNYHLNYGTRFSQGYCYTGRYHNHWSYSCYDARYGTTCYYDPYCSSWYYWCEPASCYYPVSYCPYNTYCWE